ncbi:MAG: potassium uptake system protein [Anaerolineae bacterium]|nr:MAG: potassium uptake system protein [Anaerolineae bacterium]
MFGSFKNKQKEFAVIGLGRFGRAVVRTLSEKGHSVLGIDKDPQLVQAISEVCTQAVVLDSTNEASLRALDIASFETVVVAIGSDFESNLITTVALKALGVKRVICKALTQRQKDILLRVGADRVIQPEADAGRQLANELAAPNFIQQIAFGETHSVLELRAPQTMVGKSLAELDLRKQYGANIVALKHKTSVSIFPPAEQVIQENDILVVIGLTETINKLTELQ